MQSELICRAGRYAKGKGRLSLRIGLWYSTLLWPICGIISTFALLLIFDSWINPALHATGDALFGLSCFIFCRQTFKNFSARVLIFRADRILLRTSIQSWKIDFSPQASFRLLKVPGIRWMHLVIDEPGKPSQRIVTTLKREQLAKLTERGHSVTEARQWGSYSALIMMTALLTFFVFENSPGIRIFSGALIVSSFLVILSERRKFGKLSRPTVQLNFKKLFLNRITFTAVGIWCLGLGLMTKAYVPHSHYDREIFAISGLQQKNLSQAKNRLEALLTEYPKPHVQNRLAWILTTAPDLKMRDYPRAISLAERAVGKKAWPAYLDTLACAEMGNGNSSRALKIAQEHKLKDRIALFTRGGLCEMETPPRKENARALATEK